jgi:hypothetical protein
MSEELTKDHIGITIDNRNQEGPWDKFEEACEALVKGDFLEYLRRFDKTELHIKQ